MAEKWIDVSAHNGIIDWQRVRAAGIVGAVIRAGYGNSLSQKDKQFVANITGAIKVGLKIGIYYFSYADSVADARAEWTTCKRIIQPYKSHILFVAEDYEYDSYNYYRRIHGAAPSNTLINQMVNAFLGAAKADGWGTMLYTNNDYRRNIFSTATLAVWDVWLADYTGTPDISCAIQQTGSTGHVDGITGNVDTDTCYKVYGASQPPRTAVRVDTTGTVKLPHGGVYQLRTTCPRQPGVTSARPDIVKVLHRARLGEDDYWYLVAVGGKPGDGVGVYAAAPGEAPLRRMIVEIK